MSTVNQEVDQFFGDQRARMAAIGVAADKFVKGYELKEEQVGYVQLQLRELDLKLREAMHRISDLCAVIVQSPRAAAEIVGEPK